MADASIPPQTSPSDETSPAAIPPQGTPRSVWGMRIFLVMFVALVMPVVTSIIYAYPPAENTFYPGCYFNKATGLHCCGCGATRCVHSLLHLDIVQALAWNPLFVIMLPFILYGLTRMACEMWTGRRLKWYRWPRWGTKVIMWSFLAFWIVRNIPYEPFTLLAPHKLDRPDPEQRIEP
jgi:hypothetical protein